MQTIKTYKFSKYIIILCFFIMLINPAVTLSGAQSGLLLWFNVIIPSLLPSIIISNFIVTVYGDSFKNPFWYIIFTGLLCGYPLGAATTVQLADKSKVNKEKLQYIMAVCNNSSPMFIMNYIIISSLKQKDELLKIIMIIYLPLFILLLLFAIRNRNFSNSVVKNNENDAKRRYLKSIDMHSIDTSIMSGFEIVTKVGGYIILFSVLGAFIQTLPTQHEIIKSTLSALFEITTGINFIAKASYSMNLKILLCCTFTAFGGLSCIAQTYSIIHNSNFSIKKYIYHKLLIAVMTFATGYFLIYVL